MTADPPRLPHAQRPTSRVPRRLAAAGWRSAVVLFGARLLSRFIGSETKVVYSEKLDRGRRS